MSEQLTKIIAPNLTQSDYGKSMDDVFNNIDSNFQALSNHDFIKGEKGDSISLTTIDLDEVLKLNTETPGYKVGQQFLDALANYYIIKYKNSNQIWDIDLNHPILLWFYSPGDLEWHDEGDKKLWKGGKFYYYPMGKITIAECNGSVYLSAPYNFIDQRFYRDDVLQLAQSFSDTEDSYENFIDESGLFSYNNSYTVAEKISSNTTLYYKNGQMYWCIAGNNTDIPASGPRGYKGEKSLQILCVTDTDDPDYTIRSGNLTLYKVDIINLDGTGNIIKNKDIKEPSSYLEVPVIILDKKTNDYKFSYLRTATSNSLLCFYDDGSGWTLNKSQKMTPTWFKEYILNSIDMYGSDDSLRSIYIPSSETGFTRSGETVTNNWDDDGKKDWKNAWKEASNVSGELDNFKPGFCLSTETQMTEKNGARYYKNIFNINPSHIVTGTPSPDVFESERVSHTIYTKARIQSYRGLYSQAPLTVDMINSQADKFNNGVKESVNYTRNDSAFIANKGGLSLYDGDIRLDNGMLKYQLTDKFLSFDATGTDLDKSIISYMQNIDPLDSKLTMSGWINKIIELCQKFIINPSSGAWGKCKGYLDNVIDTKSGIGTYRVKLLFSFGYICADFVKNMDEKYPYLTIVNKYTYINPDTKLQAQVNHCIVTFSGEIDNSNVIGPTYKLSGNNAEISSSAQYQGTFRFNCPWVFIREGEVVNGDLVKLDKCNYKFKVCDDNEDNEDNKQDSGFVYRLCYSKRNEQDKLADLSFTKSMIYSNVVQDTHETKIYGFKNGGTNDFNPGTGQITPPNNEDTTVGGSGSDTGIDAGTNDGSDSGSDLPGSDLPGFGGIVGSWLPSNGIDPGMRE